MSNYPYKIPYIKTENAQSQFSLANCASSPIYKYARLPRFCNVKEPAQIVPHISQCVVLGVIVDTTVTPLLYLVQLSNVSVNYSTHVSIKLSFVKDTPRAMIEQNRLYHSHSLTVVPGISLAQ